MEIKGIDVSRWQGAIDWEKVKNDGIAFAILKAGGSDKGFYRDITFDGNYAEAKRVGIAVGAYYFVGKSCKSATDGEADARRFIEILKGKQFEYPVYIDFEAPDTSNKPGNTEAVLAFCKVMEDAGYYVGVYASEVSGFRDRLNDGQLQHISHWVARYGKKPKMNANVFHVWQFSSAGRVNGISGNVDMDISYIDFESCTVRNGLNGFDKIEDRLDNYQVAVKVIKKEWDIEDVRAYGYDMTQVQHIIDIYEKVRERI